MFGVEIKSEISGITEQANAYNTIEENANKAHKAIKELKRQTLGFDEIHNINQDTNSSTPNTGIVNSGIDKKLLESIQGYDNGMEKVRAKATEIRDKIMEWLGFTEEINPLIGEVTFKLQDGYNNLKKIYDFVKLIAITMISWKFSKSVIEFFNNLSQESFSKNFEKTMGLTILFTSLMYNIDAISKQLRNGPDLAINIQGITSSIGLDMSTYMMTKNLTLTLLVTAIDLVFQAGVSINKLW